MYLHSTVAGRALPGGGGIAGARFSCALRGTRRRVSCRLKSRCGRLRVLLRLRHHRARTAGRLARDRRPGVARRCAVATGDSMLRDFAGARGDFHPILTLPAKAARGARPVRWSRSTGCYQFKSAMAWWDLYRGYRRGALPRAVRGRCSKPRCARYREFLPGHPERHKVMDRLHAFCYFLEGLLPRADDDRRCAAALRDGIARAAHALRDIAPRVRALRRVRAVAARAAVRRLAGSGAARLGYRGAASAEATAGFQASAVDPRIDGGFWFGRKDGEWLPFVNPVSTAFAGQALELWEASAAASRAAPPPADLTLGPLTRSSSPSSPAPTNSTGD